MSAGNASNDAIKPDWSLFYHRKTLAAVQPVGLRRSLARFLNVSGRETYSRVKPKEIHGIREFPLVRLMWKRLESSRPDVLIYRRGGTPALLVGLTFAGIGVALFVGSAINPWCWGFLLCPGAIISLTLVSLGVHAMVGRSVTFDRSLGQATLSWRWLFREKSDTYALASFDRIGWSHRRDHPPTYHICLHGPNAAALGLFWFSSMDDARRLTNEIAAFLAIPAEHWDEALLHTTREGYGPDDAPWFERLIGRQPMHRVAGGIPKQLRYCQSFETILKGLSWGFLAIGLVFLGVALTAGPELGPEYPAFLAVGSIFPLLALFFLMGRRGIIFDKESHCVITWWGLLTPMLRQVRDLSAFRTVAVKRSVKTAGDYPVVRASVLLTGDKALIVHDHRSKEAAESMAREIAAFLGWDLHPLETGAPLTNG
jgi:hypothetical protein